MSLRVDLKGKIAIVTGAGGGIGEATSKLLAEAGCKVVLVDLNEEAINSVAQKIPTTTLALKVDVADLASTKLMVKKVIDEFGSIDILVNNAGITRDVLLLRMKDEEWREVLDVNLGGTFNCTREVIKWMVKQRAGKIVNISSTVGLTGNVGQANYAASKAAIIGFTKSCAKEVASRGINVNAICPGFIQTPMTQRLPERVRQDYLSKIPLARFGKPIDIANAVLFLVSDAASFITGQVVIVDGGMVM
jgi:3-oxoacyl-[acyl-carrier protein] reductase